MTKWKQGESGNKTGRPRGRPDRRSRLRDELAKHGDAIVAKIVELALNGEPVALKIAADRLLPALRAESPRRPIRLDGLTLEARGRAVIEALGVGELSADEAGTLLQGIARQSETEKVGLLADVVARLAADRGLQLPPELELRRQIPTTIDTDRS